MTTAPAHATARLTAATTTCHGGRASCSWSSVAPKMTLTIGQAAEPAATVGARRPVARPSCWKTMLSAVDDQDVQLRIGEHRAQALMQLRQDRLGHHRRQARCGSGNRAVRRGLDGRSAPVACHHKNRAHGGNKERRHQPLLTGSIVPAVRRIAHHSEHREARDDQQRRADLPPGDLLRRQPDAERQHKHDGHRQKRLNDRDPASVQRSGLQTPADDDHDPQRQEPYTPQSEADE